MPAAEPSKKLFMSVMCDLQLDMAGVGFLLIFDIPGPNPNRNQIGDGQPPLPVLTESWRFAPANPLDPARSGISRSAKPP
jgi:hypothetical protein